MTDFVRRVVGASALPIAVFMCLVMAGTMAADYFSASKYANDFSVYWRTANQPVEQAYSWTGRFPFPYAPTMLPWIAPLGFIPKWPAYFLFIGMSAVALVWSIRPYLSKGAIALCLISPPFVRGMFTGQVSALLSAALIWTCGTPNRLAAGITLGCVASIKPQLVIMAPLMLALNRDWRAFISAGAAFAGILLLTLALYGPARWPEWVASMPHFQRMVMETNVANNVVSLAAIAVRFDLPPIPFMLLGTVVGALLTYLCRDAEPLEKATAIALGSILAAPYALTYDITAIVPFLALAIIRGRIMAVFGLVPVLQPLPAIVSTYELVRGKLPQRRFRHARV